MFATIDPQPRMYGSILFGNVNQSPRAELPSLGRFLSQGVAVGTMLSFLWPLISMLAHPENGYNFLLISYLPLVLGVGLLFGLCEGATIWAATYLVGRRINLVLRAFLGMVILYGLMRIASLLFWEPSPSTEEASLNEYLVAYSVFAGCGTVLGLTIGSRFRPHYELIRGTTTDQWPVMCGLTGLFLRVLVIFGSMISILILIDSTQGDFHRKEFVFSLVAVCHFAIALVILFVRMPFWLLLLLALITNFPIVALVTDVLTTQDDYRIFTLSYLILWAAFLSFRASLPRRPLAFFKRELRPHVRE